ncbi:MAG: hypothetical protein IPP72_19650 [Chitinophagaceae bacterium]|nr:hypothetical protein [Chitinophagaceae bacterium]
MRIPIHSTQFTTTVMFTIKRNLTVIIGIGLMCMSYSTSKLLKDPNSPINYTGAPKAVTPNLGQVRYCSNSGCHSDFGLDPAGGNVIATGLPTGTYVAGQTYNFSIKITRTAGGMTNWGFAIKAVNTVDNDVVGTFSSTNANASLKGTVAGKTAELSHSNAPATAASSNYTFLNLKWTAPSTPTTNQTNIRFYIVGVAGDNDGSEAGDYVYSTTVSASIGTLPVTLTSFNVLALSNNTASVNWQTSQEISTAYYEVETSSNGSNWVTLSSIISKGNSSSLQSYSYTDKKPVSYNSNIYYRLKMVDLDGSYSYSAIQTLRLKNAGLIIDNLSAQPLKGGKNLIFKIHSNTNQAIAVFITDINGRLLYNYSTNTASGTNTFEIPAANLSRGMVYIKFVAGGSEKTFNQLIE